MTRDDRKFYITATLMTDWKDRISQEIVLTMKQALRLLAENDNKFQNINAKLYFKYGKLQMASEALNSTQTSMVTSPQSSIQCMKKNNEYI